MLTRKSRLLWWDGQRGLAYFDGVHAELAAAPHLSGEPVEEIDYAPGVGTRSVRLRADTAWREMYVSETVAVDTMLGHMVNAVRSSFS